MQLFRGNMCAESPEIPSDYKKGYMFTVSNSDQRRGNLWKEEVTIGLKNAVKQKDWS